MDKSINQLPEDISSFLTSYDAHTCEQHYFAEPSANPFAYHGNHARLMPPESLIIIQMGCRFTCNTPTQIQCPVRGTSEGTLVGMR